MDQSKYFDILKEFRNSRDRRLALVTLGSIILNVALIFSLVYAFLFIFGNVKSWGLRLVLLVIVFLVIIFAFNSAKIYLGKTPKKDLDKVARKVSDRNCLWKVEIIVPTLPHKARDLYSFLDVQVFPLSAKNEV